MIQFIDNRRLFPVLPFLSSILKINVCLNCHHVDICPVHAEIDVDSEWMEIITIFNGNRKEALV